MKNQLVLVAGILIGAACVPVSAATVVATLPEFSGGYFTGGFPQPTVNVGTFNFALPAGDQIVSAMFNSTFGNSSYGNSAGVQVYLGNVLAGTCAALAPCDLNLTPTPFSYVFKASDFASLQSGSLAVSATQTSGNIIRFGQETLTITTSPAGVPEPGSLGLLGFGLTGLGYWRTRKRNAATL